MVSWLGIDGAQLAARLGLPRVDALGTVPSTMDAAHAAAAAGAPAGTLIVAEAQSAGRGRGGRVWHSAPGSGLWMTLVERPRTPDGLDLLSLRVGLHLAPVLERWSEGPIRLKWPNDLFVGRRKLAGVLIEARWRGAHPDWVAIGLGINLQTPRELPDSASLTAARAEEVLAEVIPAVRAAAFAAGPLRDEELAEFSRRDLAVGRRISLPVDGLVRGISPNGELLVETASGVLSHRAGSLVFANS